MVLLSNPPFDFHRLLQSLSQILEVAYDFEVPLPSGKLKSICFALHTQVRGGRSCTTHPKAQQVPVPLARQTQLMAMPSPTLLVTALLGKKKKAGGGLLVSLTRAQLMGGSMQIPLS